MLEILLIAITNFLVFYLIMKVNYVRWFFITKLMFISFDFKIFENACCIYDGSVVSRWKTRSY